MRYFILFLFLPQLAFGNVTVFATKPVHDYVIKDGAFTLRSPQDKSEWMKYHHIRHNEVHRRYFLGYAYDFNEADENKDNHFRFVLEKQGHIIGQVRIDVTGESCTVHWPGIASDDQGKGYGSKMLRLSETFCRNHTDGKRMRAEPHTEAEGFFLKNGYVKNTTEGGVLMKDLAFNTK